MDQITEEQFSKMYRSLPIDLKEILNSSSINESIGTICEEYGFPEKFSEFQRTIALVLMGTISLEDFKNYLGVLAQQGSIAVYNKVYALAFAPVEKYLLFENGQTFFGSVPAPSPKDNPAEPLRTSSAPPAPANNEGPDPYREKPE